MSPAPTETKDTRRTQNYAHSWRATMQLVRSGSSWSGRERNCVYLNGASAIAQNVQFANVSAVSGLDFADDGRGLALVDWDQDGDLDLWFRNRTAPRLRLMRNRARQQESPANFVRLRLQGTTCNRDAIGARVEVTLDRQPPQQRLVQTIRAGDAFLSQSSKWVHFGLDAAHGSIRDVTVRWPGGTIERFTNVRLNGSYQLTQGAGSALALNAPAPPRLLPAMQQTNRVTASARIVLPGRISLPTLDRVELGDANTTSGALTTESDEATLFLFWTSACPNCRQELAELTAHATQLRDAGIRIVAICLDGLGDLADTGDSGEAAAEFLQRIAFPFESTATTAESLERIRQFQNALFNKYPNFVIPFSFLADAEGRVVAIYRGAVSHEVLVRDLQLTSLSESALRDLAVPFSGSWFTKPATESQFAEYVGNRLSSFLPNEALRYYKMAVSAATSDARHGDLHAKTARAHLIVARNAIKLGNPNDAEQHFAAALKLAPASATIHYDYGVFMASRGDVTSAKQHLRKALQLQPQLQAAERALQKLNEES